MVAAYKDVSYGDPDNIDSINLVPFFDVIFSGTGEIFIPEIITGEKDYDPSEEIINRTGAYISGSESPEYFYLSASEAPYPVFVPILEWSSNCPDNVLGCP